MKISGHHEEAHRPALLGRGPVVAVVGEEDAQPGGGDADAAGQRPWPCRGRRVSRRAVAAGPISSAVLRMVPTATEDSDTDTPISRRKASPTVRTGTPWAAARSVLTELSRSGRYKTGHRPPGRPRPGRSWPGTVIPLTSKSEPNRMVMVAPVVLDGWCRGRGRGPRARAWRRGRCPWPRPGPAGAAPRTAPWFPRRPDRPRCSPAAG